MMIDSPPVSGGWDIVKGHVRQSLSRIEGKMHELSQISLSLSQSVGGVSGVSASKIEAHTAIVTTQCAKVDDINNEISKLFTETHGWIVKLEALVCTPTQEAHVTRFRDVYNELIRECKKLQADAEKKKQRALLLHGSERSSNQEGNGLRHLVRERETLDESIAVLDQVIGSASESHSKLKSQRHHLNSVGVKLSQIGSKVPELGQIMTRIGWAHRKTQIVLASVFGLCVCFIVWWSFLS
eukprot:GHVR01109974.1.p1 GENE.GHVR01109974.1~~GHVR01109974.1.p1  ORF type:complete len:240 (+),score=48.63 GHVR01109974.1:41-760(+)